ncbi:MAG: DUF2795 domain-containing protein [Frankiaceae bacterium]
MESSDKHGAALDDQLKHETAGLVTSGRSTRAQEWRDPQAAGEDEPEVDRAPGTTLTGGTPDGMTAEDVERRSRLASYLDRSAFPAVRGQLVDDAAANHAPDEIMAELHRLPDGREFANVNDVWTALGGGSEAHRF